MAKPVQSFRLDPEHRDLVNAVIARLDAGDRAGVEAALGARPVGPFKSADAALDVLTSRLVTMLRPAEIWLFGSRARGDHEAESDFDLLVVLPEGRAPQAYSYEAVAEPVLSLGVPVDVVPCSVDAFDAAHRNETSVVGAAKREGRQLYAARERRRDRPDAVRR